MAASSTPAAARSVAAVSLRNRQGRPRLGTARLRRLAAALCAAAELSPSALSLTMAGDRTLRRLNREYRGKDSPTDVLSFPIGGGQPAGVPTLVGDVVISYDTAARQARAAGHSLEAEVCRLWAPSAPLALRLIVAVIGMEWLRGEVCAFPWGMWGSSQVRHMPLAHLASLGGVPLVGAWLSAVGAGLAVPSALGRRRRLCWAALAGLYCVGGALGLQPRPGVAMPPVGLVQGNVGQDAKNAGVSGAEHAAALHLRLSAQAQAGGAAWLVWPETVLPYTFDPRQPWPAPLRPPLPTLLGCLTRRPPDRRLYNSSAFIEPGGSWLGSADKQHLVPFGEYVPLRALLPIEHLVPQAIDITPGRTTELVGGPLRLGPMVCYDGVFASVARSLCRAGALVLVNITNDGWYGLSSGPYQHLDFYRWRAIETGRWVVRASNPGISAIIDAHGQVRTATALGEQAVRVGQVQSRAQLTFYTRLGDWPQALAAALAAWWSAAAVLRRVWASRATSA